jgi:hypothetical protein
VRLLPGDTGVTKHLVKTTRPRLVPLDCGYAVDVAGLTLVLKRRGDGWTIIIDDAAELTYRCDENDMCHIAIEKAA